MLYDDPKFLKELEAIAQKIISDFHWQKVLVHVAHIHIWQLETAKPNQKRTWYRWSCKNRMLNWLAEGSSVDSLKRRHLGCDAFDAEGSTSWTPEGLISRDSVLAAVSAKDLVSVISRRLRPRERFVLKALDKGFDETEIGQAMGITRQAVGRYRRKIRQAAAATVDIQLAA